MAKPASWHVLSNVDLEAKTGDCSICGSGVRIRVRVINGSVKRGCDSHSRDARGHARKRGYAPMRTASSVVNAALEEQGGRCVVCQRELELVPDHDHTTGAFRGWLCRGCNLMLGYAEDDPATLRAAAAYLEAGAHPLG